MWQWRSYICVGSGHYLSLFLTWLVPCAILAAFSSACRGCLIGGGAAGNCGPEAVFSSGTRQRWGIETTAPISIPLGSKDSEVSFVQPCTLAAPRGRLHKELSVGGLPSPGFLPVSYSVSRDQILNGLKHGSVSRRTQSRGLWFLVTAEVGIFANTSIPPTAQV